MKKLSNKGLGHHLLLMVVAVVAVIGAAGYFVWQRQQDNDIDAKAAGYTYLNKLTPYGGMGAATVPRVDWYACKRLLPNGNYNVSVIAKSTTKERPILGVGYGKTIVHTKSMGSLISYQFPSFAIPSSNYLSVKTTVDPGFSLISYYLSDITAC